MIRSQKKGKSSRGGHTRTQREIRRFVNQFIHSIHKHGALFHCKGGTRDATNQHVLEDVRAMNSAKKLRSQLLNKEQYPIDFALVKANKQHLPTQLQTIDDYQQWLVLRVHLTDEGKQRFGRLRDFAKEEFSSDAVHNAKKSATWTPVLPPTEAPPPAPSSHHTTYVPPRTTEPPPLHSRASSTADPGSVVKGAEEVAVANVEGVENSKSVTDQQEQQQQQPSYHDTLRRTQLLHTPEEKAHYQQMALKEADQRQLLMLLCGDVEADMFFDENGEMRGPRQIIEQVLFLLEPYHMSNSRMGVWAKHIYFYTNYVWKYGTTVAALVVSVMTLYHIGLFMMMCTRTLHETGAYTTLIKGFLNKSAFLFIALFNSVMAIVTRQLRVPNRGTSFNGRLGREFTKMLCVGGPPAMLWWFLTRTKVDYSNNQQMSLAMYCTRTLHDRHKQLDAMHYLAQLTPGFFGDDLSTGITNGQLGVICCMQEELMKLDAKVDALTQDQYGSMNAQYNKSGRGTGITERKIDLANVLNSAFNQALLAPVDETTQPTLVAFRKTLLGTYKEDMRCFHFLDAYGHPRDIVGICKAYFIYWQMCEQSQRLPTIPYEGNGTLAEYMKLTPLQQLRTKRKTMKASKNIPQTWWRQHPFLYTNDKTPIDLQEALRTEPSGILSLFDDGNQKAIRKHKGWTHRISQIGKENAIERFHLNTLMLSKEYDLVKRHASAERKRALLENSPESMHRWNDARDLNVFDAGVKLQARDTPKAFTAGQKKTDGHTI